MPFHFCPAFYLLILKVINNYEILNYPDELISIVIVIKAIFDFFI